MSTAKLLNKNASDKSAKRRAQAIRELERFSRSFAGASPGRYRVESLAASLKEVHNDPRFTGAQKDAKFKSLLNRAR